MAFSKPRLQLFAVSLFCVLLIASAVVYADRSNQKRVGGAAITATTTRISDENLIDGSGSDAWKEQFINTKNASSSPSKGASTTSQIPQTLTDQLGRNFFVNFIGLQQKNLVRNEQAVQDVVDNLIYSTALETPVAKTYSLLDVQVIASDDQSVFKAYGNNTASVFNTYAPRTDVIDVVKNAFDTNDMKVLTQIDPIIHAYQKTIDGLLAMNVPYELSAYHVELINSLSRSKYVAEGLRKIESDPTLALYSLNEYVSSREAMYNAFVAIKNILAKKGVIYSSTEPGILFSTII